MPERMGRAAAMLAFAAMLGLGIGGCAQRQRAQLPIAPDGHVSTASTLAARADAPAWARQTHSWRKLDEIERWIDERSAASAPEWQIEAALQLAEGKLEFARGEANAAAASEILAYRRASAMEGFRGVASNPDASRDQKHRATVGIRGVNDAGGASGGRATAASATLSAPIDGLVTRSAWRAAAPKTRDMRRANAPWQWITVHHSAFYSDGGPLETVRRVQRDHMKNDGWGDIGYHFLIDREGRVIEGRSLSYQGAHAGGTNNIGNVGICLLGNFDTEHPTPAAIRSLERLIVELQSKLRIPRPNVRPHSAWKGTKCPGENLMPWFARRQGKRTR